MIFQCKKIIRDLCLFTALFGAVQGPLFAQESEADKALVALFGDSISLGFQLGIFDPSPPNGQSNFGCPDIYLGNILRLEEARIPPFRCPTTIHDSPILDANKLTGLRRDVQVVNWGITGSDTVQGVARISLSLNISRNQFPDRTNRIVLINYGTNDINNGIGLSTTRFNLEQMVSQARGQAGFIPVIARILPRSDESNIIDSRVFDINNQIRSIAANDGQLALVDLFNVFINYPGGWPQLIRLEDFSTVLPGGRQLRIHPNDQGYLLIAEQWFDQFLRANITPLPIANNPIITPILNLLLDEQ